MRLRTCHCCRVVWPTMLSVVLTAAVPTGHLASPTGTMGRPVAHKPSHSVLRQLPAYGSRPVREGGPPRSGCRVYACVRFGARTPRARGLGGWPWKDFGDTLVPFHGSGHCPHRSSCSCASMDSIAWKWPLPTSSPAPPHTPSASPRVLLHPVPVAQPLSLQGDHSRWGSPAATLPMHRAHGGS